MNICVSIFLLLIVSVIPIVRMIRGREIIMRVIDNLSKNEEFLKLFPPETFINYNDVGRVNSAIIKYSKVPIEQLTKTGLYQRSIRGMVKCQRYILSTVNNKAKVG